MAKSILGLLSLILSQIQLSAQTISIAEARNQPTGQTVTVKGIVTNGAELGRIRYLQDGTAGIGAFPGNGSVAGFETAVGLGAEVEITGKLLNFNGLLEISPITAFSVLSENNPLPAPIPTTIADLSEDLEGQLVVLECIKFDNPGGTFSNATTYPINDSDGGSSVVFLRNTSPLIGTSIPAQTVKMTAILSQYNDYQLLPRDLNDFQTLPCLHFVEQPTESAINASGFKVHWKTNQSAFCVLKFGDSQNLTQEIMSTFSGNEHEVALSGLQAGKIYWVQAVATHNGETAISDVVPFATRSLSSGKIKVYFNQNAGTNFPGAILPDGQSPNEVLAETIARIDSATQTIDVAVYNNNRTDITNALKQAHARGVRVRYIASEEGSSAALEPPPPFPVVWGNSINLMHNKVMVIDADLTDKCWVMSGSLNWTQGNMYDDYNNTLFIQDQSLARAYELEINEMWGSDGSQPNLAVSRFGNAKRDNTPHKFIIGPDDIRIESYFSPSDKVTSRIETVLRSAQEDLQFALLTFTKDELGQAVVDEHFDGTICRGIIDNYNDNGSEYQFLLDNGVNVVGDPNPRIVHHKYGVVDATLPSSDPTVVTGSHNWTFTAETGNDENTLVIHDARIARLYWQEFNKRWSEVTTSTQTIDFQQFKVFPNPANESVFISSTENFSGEAILKIVDTAGKLLFEKPVFIGEKTFAVPTRNLPNGLFFLKISTAHGVSTLPFQKISD